MSLSVANRQNVISPDLGGFVCGEGSHPTWVSTVARVWSEYYRAGAYVPFETVDSYGSGGTCASGGLGFVHHSGADDQCGCGLRGCRRCVFKVLDRTVEGCGGTSEGVSVGGRVLSGESVRSDVVAPAVVGGGNVSGGECDTRGVDDVEQPVPTTGIHSGGSRLCDGSVCPGDEVSSASKGSSGDVGSVSVEGGVFEEVKGSVCKNRAKRQLKKARKVRKQEAAGVPEWRRKGEGWKSCSEKKKNTEFQTSPARYVAGLVNADADSELTDSVKRKWVIKNQLEIAKAERELAILKGGDVEDDVRKKNVVTRAAIERNIVAIERCHASLRGTDSHSLDDEARVATVLSGVKSDTISPDSSASRSDYKKTVLELHDKSALLIEKDKAIALLTAKLKGMGVDVTGVEDVAKSEWTVDGSGQVTREHQLKFSDYGYSWTTGFNEPRLCEDGKERIRVDFFD